MPGPFQLNLGAGYRDIGQSQPMGFEQGWNADTMQLPFGTSEVDGIWAHGFFEHVRDVPKVLWECQRVLRVGGVLNIVVPHGRSEIAVEDLTHKQFIVEHSWRNLFQNEYYDAGHGLPGRWQLRLHANFMMAVAYRNMALFSQFVKEG
jgi:predicted SAM-dependent methyltransferase